MPHCSTNDILELMNSKRLRRLRSVADSDLLLLDDLDDYGSLVGYTKEDTWRILTAIRKQAAIFLPDDPYRSVDCWFHTTSAISFDSKQIEIRCKADFPLETSLSLMKGSPFLTRFIEQTLQRAFESEGMDVDEQRIHGIFSGNRQVQDDLDKVINNYFQISRNAESLSHREVTPGLVEAIYYRLIEGVDLNNIPKRQQTAPLNEDIAPSSSWEGLDAICRRIDFDRYTEVRFGPILRLLNINWFFWYFDIFPYLNSLVGVLLRNVVAVKWGYPVLCWIPVGCYPYGDFNTPRIKAAYIDWSTDYGFGYDFTPYYFIYGRHYLAELDRLEAAVAQLQELNSLIARTLNLPMNERQKSILSAICKEPDCTLRIGPHQRTFGVAYATARHDFLELEEWGCLERHHEGRAFVFKACQKLRDTISVLGESYVSHAVKPG